MFEAVSAVAAVAVELVAEEAVVVEAAVADSETDTVMTAIRGYTHTNTSADFALGHRSGYVGSLQLDDKTIPH